jgi:acyl-CoA thioester hydrolase
MDTSCQSGPPVCQDAGVTAETILEPDRPGQQRAERHRYVCSMRWGDMDAQGHVNNASYLDYLQEARVDFLLSGPPALQDLLSSGVLVVSHQVEYLQPVTFGYRPLRIDLWVDSVGGSRFGIGYDVFDGEVLAARARTAAVPYTLATGTLRRLSQDERALLKAAQHPAAPLPVVPRVPVRDPAHHYRISARWSDLDSYAHVNNVKYFDYLQEARIALIAETLGWSSDQTWFVVRQDLEYLRPIDFRTAPYEVVTGVSDVGTRSFRLAVEIRDPDAGTTLATARTVVVGGAPLTGEMRVALSRWAVEGP